MYHSLLVQGLGPTIKMCSAIPYLQEKQHGVLDISDLSMISKVQQNRKFNSVFLQLSWDGLFLAGFGLELLALHLVSYVFSRAWCTRLCCQALRPECWINLILIIWTSFYCAMVGSSCEEMLVRKLWMPMVWCSIKPCHLLLYGICCRLFPAKRNYMFADFAGIKLWLPHLHCTMWFACMFGWFSFEDEPTITDDFNVTPSAKFHQDILGMAVFEDGRVLVDWLGGQTLRVFAGLRGDFLRIDVTPIRFRHFRYSIPPPGYVPPMPAVLVVDVDVEADVVPQYVCPCLRDDGSVYAEKAKASKDGTGQHPPGEPHVHAWAAMLRVALEDPALNSDDKQCIEAHRSAATDPVMMSHVVYVSKLRKAEKSKKWSTS
ncbi:unnamed protein product [Polarella glacialis]|uniref:Uncharacterized protein n=1 Tax=Polarella glacialis TaxID=89957 RepID=A0A813LSR4_POLGL|nr:unnamed protein product [Polarella glacialis]